MNELLQHALSKSILNYVPLNGTSLEERSDPFFQWRSGRLKLGVWPFHRVLMSQTGPLARAANPYGERPDTYVNFASQDYLGLAQDDRVKVSAKAAIDVAGVHSAGSPAAVGRTDRLLSLEDRICRILRKQCCMICATGWAAGFGVLQGLVRERDTIVMDALAHNCLQEGARHATTNIRRFRHNDLNHLRHLLAECRATETNHGLFVIVESLYSMDSDSPDLQDTLRLVREHDGILIIDVAHDFGCMGERGLGLLEALTLGDGPDVIMGSFSKTFASNGGFIACSEKVRDYLGMHCSPFVFSNAISPIQTEIVSTCMDIVFSEEGNQLRRRLLENITLLRANMKQHGLEVAGAASPIVPVYVGDEQIARLTFKHVAAGGLLANMVEYPAVAKGKARFRFQVMSTHSKAAIIKSAAILAQSKAAAWEELCRANQKDKRDQETKKKREAKLTA